LKSIPLPKNKKSILLITKDVLRADYLPVYGNNYWHTPNITALAEQGTVFRRHYTAAPSSAMSYTAMFTGLYPHQLDRRKYSEVKPFTQCPTLFDILADAGFSCHVIWDKHWLKTAYPFSKIYGDERTTFHNLDISQSVGPHKIESAKIDEAIVETTIADIAVELKLAFKGDGDQFVWIHLPHVMKGRSGYGSDIDVFDKIVGKARGIVGDDSIYISADHGHMNAEKGIPVYGFHVYEGAARIPLITPRIMGRSEIEFATSNTQLMDILLHQKIQQEKIIFSDTQYYLQSNRKLAIIYDNYKYIYNKRDRTEEMYDLNWDAEENVNLLIDRWYDRNRKYYYNIRELVFYPEWEKVDALYSNFTTIRESMWRSGSRFQEFGFKLYNLLKTLFIFIKYNLLNFSSVKGQSNSKIKYTNYHI
jgi:hypothetical protein